MPKGTLGARHGMTPMKGGAMRRGGSTSPPVNTSPRAPLSQRSLGSNDIKPSIKSHSVALTKNRSLMIPATEYTKL